MRNLIFPLLLLVTACGSSALERHVSAAAVTRVGLNFAADAIETVCDPARVAATEDVPAAAQRCLKALEGHDTARAAWSVWAEALILAENDDAALDIALGLALPVLRAYGELAQFLQAFDINLPALPALLGGESQ